MVAMRITKQQWEDLKSIARYDNKSLSATLDRLINKQIEKRADDIKTIYFQDTWNEGYAGKFHYWGK